MTKKTFATYAPTEVPVLEIEVPGKGITSFNMNAKIPGDLLLDFMSGADTDNPSSMAKTVRALLDAAIVAEDLDRWHEFIREPSNYVDLDKLSEIAGWATEVLSGNPQQQPLPSTSG